MKTATTGFKTIHRGLRRWCRAFILSSALLVVVWARTQPSDAGTGSKPNLTLTSGGGPFLLHLQGQAGQVYEIQSSSNLKNWTALATKQASGSGAVIFADPVSGQVQQRFYRAVVRSDLAGLGGGGFRSDRILVKPKAGLNLATLNLSLGVSVLNVFSGVGNLHVLRVPAGLTASTLIQRYQTSGLVQYAERDFYVQALEDPNDPHYVDGEMWGLKNTGQNGGTPGADIHAAAAWDTTTSAGNITIAVVDTGLRYTHEDLAANIWVNPADGSHGTNTVAGNTNPNDDHGHGTHVSGTIGAVGNNGLGVVGVCWNAQIMALKFIDSTGNGTISDAIACLDYARTHGAKAVNASWGTTNFTSQSLHDAIASLRDADIIFVAAAGNSSADNDTVPLYPASYRDLDNVVAVAATDRNDQLAGFSDYGANTVDLAAPGTAILSCWNGSDHDYEEDDGTSMACAHVTGAVALLRAYFPGENYKQIIQRILSGTDQLPSLVGRTITGGRLNLAKALAAAPPPVVASFSAEPSSGQAPLTVQFADQSSGPVASWNWNFGDGSASSETQSPSHVYSSAGSFTTTLTVTGSSGQTDSASRTITVTNAPPPVVASFSAEPSSGQAPLTVQFADQSSGPVASWNWSFGNGSASSETRSPSHLYSSAGSFTATLTVTCSSGQTGSPSQTITVTNAQPPLATVTISATTPLASLLSPGVFTITRTGDTSSALMVRYALGGTAQNGADFQSLSGSAAIPAGASTASVLVRPAGFLTVLKTVVLTVSPDSSYEVGAPDSATVTILIEAIGL